LRLRICSEGWEEGGEPVESGRSLLRGEHVDLTLRYFLEALFLSQDAFLDFTDSFKELWSQLGNEVRNSSFERLTGRHFCKN
jgi:hypothetical protein